MRSSDVALDFDPPTATEDREAIELAVCNLLAVPGLTVPRARRLIHEFSPTGAYDALCDGGPETIDAFDNEPTVHTVIAAARRSTGLGAMYFGRCRRLGIRLWLPGDPGWADHFAADGQAPAALFYRGNLALCSRPRVAIVGTRSATPAGREMAQRFGRELSDLGIAIVSGLAFGIDANAHAGALASEDAAPIGVVGSGLDVIYPRANAELWKRVTDRGVMFSEYFPGSRPTQISFPDRNRIIAGLCDVLVVVESTESGGSMLTVNDAWVRKKPVMAVPGNPLHKSCAGSNGLLRRVLADDKRVIPCVDTPDILTVLALDRLVTNSVVESRREPDELGMEVLHELGWEGASTSKLVLRLGRPAGEVVGALGRLELDGWISCRAGQWSQVPAGVRR
jgi:DNA processing protein